MTHRAESVIAAVVTAVTGLTTTGANVYRGKITPIPAAVNDALRVYMGEDTRLDDLLTGVQDWQLTVHIESFTKSPTAQIDTRLNLIREEVTIALRADETLGLAFVVASNEAGAARPELSAEGEQHAGSQELTWEIHYRRSRADPGA